MDIIKKADKVVEILLKKTKEKKLGWWRPSDKSWRERNDRRIVGSVFVVQVGKILLAAYWREDTSMVVLLDNESKDTLWEFPHTPSTAELVMNASFLGADVEAILDQIIKA